MEKNKKRAYHVLWVTVVIIAVIAAEMFIPIVNAAMGGWVFLVPLLLLSVAGGFLVYYMRHAQWQSIVQRRFMALTGYAILAFFPLVVLHNALYAFALVFAYPSISTVLNALSAIVFIAAMIGVPSAYLIGVCGTIWMLPHNVQR